MAVRLRLKRLQSGLVQQIKCPDVGVSSVYSCGENMGVCTGWDVKGSAALQDWSKALLGQRLPSVSVSADENRHDSSATRLFRFVSELGTILITTYYYSSGSYSPPESLGCFLAPSSAAYMPFGALVTRIIPIFIIEKKRSNNSAQLEKLFCATGRHKCDPESKRQPKATVWLLLPVLWQLSPSGSSAHPG